MSIRSTGEVTYETVYDPIRGVRVKLTPEERVRQSFVYFLVHSLGYPPELITNEATITVGKSRRRCDTVVFSPVDRTPFIVLEYKAPAVTISEKTLTQALEYNSVLQANIIVVTNGKVMSVYGRQKETGTYQLFPNIPAYDPFLFLQNP